MQRVFHLTRAGLIGTIVALIVAGVCARLGIWQLDRLEQRKQRNAALAARLEAPPFALRGPPSDTTGLLYRTVDVEGELQGERSVVLGGRALQSQPGVYVITPLRLPGGRSVLVNRGWLPSSDAARTDLGPLSATSRVRMRGLLVPTEGVARPTGRKPTAPASERAPIIAPGDAASGRRTVWYGMDAEAVQSFFPDVDPHIVVQALPDSTAPRLPVRLDPPALGNGPHLGYAIQWFSFAAIALIGWLALATRRGEMSRR